jgi:hypothetical protein
MQSRTFLGLLFILLVIFLSIRQPFIDLSSAWRRTPHNPIPPEFSCIQNYLPDGVTALYFSEPDGSLSREENFSGEYFLLQYQLAPRLLAVYREQQAEFEQYDWFIAQAVEEEHLAFIMDTLPIDLVGDCGRYLILHRTGW